MTVEEFGARVLGTRKARGWSRQTLKGLSGVAVATLERLEPPHRPDSPPPTPQRSTIVGLARAFGWDVNDTLAELGEPPLDEFELAEEQRKAAEDPVRIRDEAWARMTATQQYYAARMLRSFVDPAAELEPGSPPDVAVWSADLPHVQGSRLRRNVEDNS